MKNFEDFLKTIDIESVYSNSTQSLNEHMELEEMIAKTSISFSIVLLKEYHKWLTSDGN